MAAVTATVLAATALLVGGAQVVEQHKANKEAEAANKKAQEAADKEARRLRQQEASAAQAKKRAEVLSKSKLLRQNNRGAVGSGDALGRQSPSAGMAVIASKKLTGQ